MRTTENYILEAKLIYGDEYDYSKTVYNGARKTIVIICPEHGEFEKYPNLHLKGAGCLQVETVQPNTHLQRKEGRKFIEKAIEKYGPKFDYSKILYIDKRTPITIGCPNHGDFSQAPIIHLKKETIHGCAECYYDSKTLTTEEFIREAQSKYGNTYDYSKTIYTGSHKPIIITCRKHGDFEEISRYHLKNLGCQGCQPGNYSKIAINWLNNIAHENNIHIKHAENGGEYRIPNSLYKADGYCAETNTIYEYSGCWYHGCTQCYTPENKNQYLDVTFGELYQKTLKKELFIKSQGFKLISIWGHEWPKIKPIPQKKIQLKPTPQNTDTKPLYQKIKLILKPQPTKESK